MSFSNGNVEYRIHLDLHRATFILAFGIILTGLGYLPSIALLAMLMIISLFLPPQDLSILWHGVRSENIYFLMAILATSHVIRESLLIKKLIYYVLYHLASKPKWIDKALFCSGIVLTPFLTAQSARIAVMTPVLSSLMLDKTFASTAKTHEAMMHTTFCGCILLSTVFLSGKSSNYLLVSMLTNKHSLPYGGLSWLLFSSFSGLLLITAFFIIHRIYYKNSQTPTIKRFTIMKAIAKLPANGCNERTALLMLSVLMSGHILTRYLCITTIPISIAVVSIPFFTRSRKIRQLWQMINAPFACYLVVMIGVMNLLNSHHTLSHYLAGFPGLSSWLKSPLNCVLIIFCFSWILSLLLGSLLSPAISFTLLSPAIHSSSLHIWIAIFTILMATEAWIFPYQSSYFTLFKSQIDRYTNCNTKNLIKSNACMAAVKFAVIFLSIPFWKVIGIYQ